MAPANVTISQTPHPNFSRPTTANNPSSAQNFQNIQTLAPTNGRLTSTTSHTPFSHNNASTTPLPAILSVEPKATDCSWKSKSGLHLLVILTSLIGVGCIAYLFSTLSLWPTSSYNPVAPWDLWPSLITFSASTLWCGFCLVFLILRKKRPNPIHPGLCVSINLILWLAFVFTALLALLASRMIMRFGHAGQVVEYVSMDGYTSSTYGYYALAENGTWLWERDMRLSEESLIEPRTCQGSGYPSIPPLGHSDHGSALNANAVACATQDAGVNHLWRAKPTRVAVTLVALVCQFIGLVGHFTWFVCACVDTKKYRRGRVGRGKKGSAEGMPTGTGQLMVGKE
ncbi:hypothetical protein J1614_008528 [Plenodomus biglobosus]|nr:hypothetical protein J1614_008528 [Plenodomus biglobosus]